MLETGNMFFVFFLITCLVVFFQPNDKVYEQAYAYKHHPLFKKTTKWISQKIEHVSNVVINALINTKNNTSYQTAPFIWKFGTNLSKNNWNDQKI